MKATTQSRLEVPRRAGATPWALTAACLLAALVFSSGVFSAGASAEVGDTGPGGDGNPGFAPGDLIGSLPVFIGGDSPSDAINNPALAGQKAVAQPSFMLHGMGTVLEHLIENATGTGFVTVYAQPGTNMQALVFHGDVSIALDRNVLLQATVETKYWIGPGFGSGVGVVSYGGTAGAGFHASPNLQLPLPLAALAATDILDQDHLSIDLSNRFGDEAGLHVAAYHDTIQVDQKIPD